MVGVGLRSVECFTVVVLAVSGLDLSMGSSVWWVAGEGFAVCSDSYCLASSVVGE